MWHLIVSPALRNTIILLDTRLDPLKFRRVAILVMFTFFLISAVTYLVFGNAPGIGGVALLAVFFTPLVPLPFWPLWLISKALARAAYNFQTNRQPDCPSFKSYRSAMAAHPARLAEWERQQLAWWQALDGKRFEREVERLLRRRGHTVEATGGPYDGGVDLVIRSKDQTVLVQCKAHKSPVGSPAVRDLYGALCHKGAKEVWRKAS